MKYLKMYICLDINISNPYLKEGDIKKIPKTLMIVKVTEDNFQDMEKGNVKKMSCFHKKTQRIENDKVSRYFKVSAWV